MANQDLGAQAELQAQINQLLSARAKINTDQEASLTRQLKIILALKEAMSGTANNIENARKGLDGVAKSEGDVAKAADEAAGKQKNFTAEIKKASEESDELNKRLETASKVAGVFGDALSGAAGKTVSLIKAAGNLVGSLFNVGKAILTLPLKLWSSFLDTAQSAGGGGTELRQAYEDVRKTFGDLSSGAAKQVVTSFKELKNSGAEAKEMGLSLRRVFGYGVGGLAEMLKFTSEMAGALGSQMTEIMKDIGKDMIYVTYAIKGMGLSSEQAGKAMLFYKNSGQDTAKMMKEMGGVAAMMHKQTGFSIKSLSKAMVETIEVFPQFAKKGVESMAKVAHYTHNLGISVKDLQSVFDKFDSFDQAAESASQLSQAFGVQIDAMKMVKEQDPTKRLEALRNAFKAAGKDINQMTHAERKLAEATTGLSGAAFEAALGEGNKKKQLTESEKAAKAATEAAKNQTAAMKELAKSIERIIPQGSTQQFKGFFDALVQGFETGFKRSHTMRQVFRALRRTLHQTYLMGIQLGRKFADTFPGMEKMAKGFLKIFDVENFRNMRERIVKAFSDLLKSLEGGDRQASINLFFDRVKNIIKNFFGTGATSGIGQMQEGFKKFLTVMGAVAQAIVRKMMEGMTEGIKNITDLIKNPSKITDPAAGAMGFVGSVIMPIFSQIKASWPALFASLKEMWEVVWPKIEPIVSAIGKTIGIYFITSFLAGLVAGFAKLAIVAKLHAMFTGATKKAAEGSAQGHGGGLMKRLFGGGKEAKAEIEAARKAMAEFQSTAAATRADLAKGVTGDAYKGSTKALREIGVKDQKVFGKAFAQHKEQTLKMLAEKEAQLAGSIEKAAAKNVGTLGKVTTKFSAAGKAVGETFTRIAGPRVASMAAQASKTALKAVPIVGQVVMVMDGLANVSRKMDEMEADLQESFGKTEGTIAAGSTGLLSALTLGLLPEKWYEAFGNAFGGFLKAMTDFSKKIGLQNMFGGLMKYLSGTMKVLSGLGGVIRGIFSGDADQIVKGVSDFFGGLFETVVGGLQSLGGMILDLVPMLLKAFFRLFELVFIDLPGKILDLLIGVGEAIGQGAAKIAIFASKLIESIKKGKFTEFIAKGMAELFGDPLGAIKEKFNEFGTWMSEWSERIGLKIVIMYEKLASKVSGDDSKLIAAQKGLADLEAKQAAREAAAAAANAAAAQAAAKAAPPKSAAPPAKKSAADEIFEDKNEDAVVAAAKKMTPEEEFIEAMSKAQEVASQIKDLNQLQIDLKEARAKLDKMKPDELKAAFKSVMPKFTAAMGAISEGISESGVKTQIETLKPQLEKFEDALTPLLDIGKSVGEIKQAFTALKNNVSDISADLVKTPFMKMKKELPNFKEAIVSLGEATQSISKEVNFGELGDLSAKVLAAQQNVQSIDKLMTDLVTITEKGGKLGKNKAKVEKVFTALGGIKGGKLEITHNIPGVEMKVDVHIDSRQIAKSIINVDVTKGGTGGRIKVEKRNFDPLLGF